MSYRLTPLMRAILAGGGAAVAPSSVTPVLNYVGSTTGVAPFGVVVDGTQTTCTPSSISPFHDLLYFFKCSDTGLGNFPNGQLAGTPRNKFMGGPVAAFTLTTVGTTTIQM